MMKKVAINGLGRIGRLLLRRYLQGGFKRFNLVAVNDPMPLENLLYLLRYDSIHGRADFEVSGEQGKLAVGALELPLFAEKDPAKLPWSEEGVDVVIECSGHFTKRAGAAKHLEAGARRVVISAPSPDADITLVLGVNDADFDPEHHKVISNASCTTNSLAPPLKVLDDAFGIEQALVTTIHAYTATQSLVDTAAGKKIRGRAGAINIIPTATGADAATALALPQLKGRLSALAVRVPVADGSLTDISAQLRNAADTKEVNAAFRAAAEGDLKGILAYSEEDLVSSDIIGDPHSAIIHSLSTRAQGNLVKVQAWYDNEYGYACRCLDLLERLPM
ncbi:type I glyceraldehyde-3-phosphate dehydrogenase [Microbulbifer rhizosphaerae]|uniref:Glyceraldehyde-3-phosphate dehydrogenase n=1 Tax=Microbulbifer rhizosphaerae TaxID=1562603 RepID=A0A7W4Z9F0_9GAMM|nr:type I glyceraldehyde-3-phosphate dehydrogenase [Microbulbifer rhizosphaerae]MBB3060160.1 glyceraldehyde 3-phosphate dehydrogenase/glyceraldehyde-3-phosphate dehydrogenase (NAD(P)) [Microbulbifer rhizosphaerae]